MSEKSRLIVCGPGLIGRKHVQLIQQRHDCSLVAIVGPDNIDDATFAQERGVVLLGGLESALDLGDVDGVIISAPNAYHFELAKICINRRIPFLVEKPLTDSLSDARNLVDAAGANGVPAIVGHHRAHSPLLQVAHEFISSDAFGRMVCFQGSALFYKPAHYFVDGPWRTRLGGGPILINLIHEIGMMRFFCGEIESVSAIASNRLRGYEVEDSVTVAISFQSGAIGSFILSDTAASSKSWEMTSGENPAYPHYPSDNCYHFAGTNGSLDFPSMQTRLYKAGTTPSWWNSFEDGRLHFEPKDPLALQLQHFLEVIRGCAKPKVTLYDGYMNMCVVEAIRKSIAHRRQMPVEIE